MTVRHVWYNCEIPCNETYFKPRKNALFYSIDIFFYIVFSDDIFILGGTRKHKYDLLELLNIFFLSNYMLLRRISFPFDCETEM